MKKVIYLAGPIAGLNKKEGTAWRDAVSNDLREASNGNIIGISPLRCEPVQPGMK